MVKVTRIIFWGILAFLMTLAICTMANRCKVNFDKIVKKENQKLERLDELYLEDLY